MGIVEFLLLAGLIAWILDVINGEPFFGRPDNNDDGWIDSQGPP